MKVINRWFSEWVNIIITIFIVEMLVLVILAPNILNISIMSNMVNNFLVIGIMAISMSVVIITGGIDLSVGSILSISGMTLGILWESGIPIGIAVIIAIIIGSLCGLLNGLIIVMTKVQPLIVTLATMFIYSSIALVLGAGGSIAGFPKEFLLLGTGSLFGILPVQLIIFIVIAVVFWVLLHKSTFGRMVNSIGNNEQASLYSGVKINKVKVWAYVFSGTTAGLSGVILASYFSSVRGDMGYQYEFLVITACLVGGVSVFGGSGKIIGVVMGALILGMLNEGLNMLNISSVQLKIITGCILILAVVAQQMSSYFKGRMSSDDVSPKKEIKT